MGFWQRQGKAGVRPAAFHFESVMFGTVSLHHPPENINLQFAQRILCLSACACVYIDLCMEGERVGNGESVLFRHIIVVKFIIMP